MHIHTFSIVAYDPDEQAFGVGVASKFLAVGAVVPWAQAGIGAVATQSYAKISFGVGWADADGVGQKRAGNARSAAARRLRSVKPRQVGIVDNQGRAAAHTGKECHAWAGHRTAEGFTCQGNILAGAQVIEAMADAYTAARGELADRLLAALVAGDDAGGDRRGKQSAALLVARPNGGYGGDNDRYLDLRVDDDPAPIPRLSAAAQHCITCILASPSRKIACRSPTDLARELQAMMRTGGYLSTEPNGVWDDGAKKAFSALIGTENLEERWQLDDPDVIDRVALEYLRSRFQK